MELKTLLINDEMRLLYQERALGWLWVKPALYARKGEMHSILALPDCRRGFPEVQGIAQLMVFQKCMDQVFQLLAKAIEDGLHSWLVRGRIPAASAGHGPTFVLVEVGYWTFSA